MFVARRAHFLNAGFLNQRFSPYYFSLINCPYRLGICAAHTISDQFTLVHTGSEYFKARATTGSVRWFAPVHSSLIVQIGSRRFTWLSVCAVQTSSDRFSQLVCTGSNQFSLIVQIGSDQSTRF